MRIEGPNRTGLAVGPGASRKTGAGTGFVLPEAQTQRATTTAAATGIYDVAALMALQAVEVPNERRRKAVKRGFAMLDILDDIRVDLLSGDIAPERLERLAGVLGDRAEAGEAEVDALLDEIELRARVELAKRGRYPE